jgi:hypothetical protein
MVGDDWREEVNQQDERALFEKWYVEHAASQGVQVSSIYELREDNHYGGHRTMLNGKWEGWQARAALDNEKNK